MTDRQPLPKWPRLMGEELAARYLSIGEKLLRERGPKPRKVGRRTLYDRLDLDRWADQLCDQPLPTDPVDILKESKRIEREYLESLKDRKLS